MEPYLQETIIGMGVVILLLLGIVLRLEIRLRKMLRGKGTKNIEESLGTIERDLSNLAQFKKEVTSYLEKVEQRLKRSVQGVGTVRFNPFRGNGEGGNQSFASSFVNEKGDGLIISTLYSRDHVSIFAKPITDGRSEYELTQEERESLKQAKEKLRSESPIPKKQ